MDESRLNEFSKRFATGLFQVFPEWRKYAVINESDPAECSIRIEVLRPDSSAGEGQLWISTEDDEITVGFDYYHVHFNRYSDDDESDSFAEAVSLIRDVVNEEVVVLSWWSGDQWRGSINAKRRATITTPEWAQSSESMRIRSWRGSYDRDTPTRLSVDLSVLSGE